MPLWKKILIRSFGLGAGFALTLCAFVGTWIWFQGRPKPPKPWDKGAITSEYDTVQPVGDKNNLTFNYVLQNNTDVDYRVDNDFKIEITGKLKGMKALGEFAGHYVTTNYPIFIPAHRRVRVSLSIPYRYPVVEKADASHTERQQFRMQVAKYVTEEMGNLDGFVLFDGNNRYEIDFPSGWEKAAKESTDSATK